MVDSYKKFEGYVEYVRRLRNDTGIYLEMEKVATRWSERQTLLSQALMRKQERLRASRGTSREL